MKTYDLDVRGAAKYLGMSVNELYRRVEAREIRHLRTAGPHAKHPGKLKFAAEDLDAWNEGRVVDAKPEPEPKPRADADPHSTGFRLADHVPPERWRFNARRSA